MKHSLYDCPFDRAFALRQLAHGRADATLAMIAKRVEDFSQRNMDYAYGTIHGTLYEALEICGATYVDGEAAIAAVAALPERTAGLIGRLANRTAWYSLRLRRLAKDSDAHTFLAHVAISPEMLTRTLMCPAFQRRLGCEAILTDPSLSALGIADALIARDPDIARGINADAFAGAPVDLGARRFYRIGNNAYGAIRIGDAQTGDIVYRGDLDLATADLMIARLETDPPLAAQFVENADAITHQQRCARLSRRGLADDAPRTPDAAALDPLYDAREALVMTTMGEEAYRANAARIQAETDAWIAGTPR